MLKLTIKINNMKAKKIKKGIKLIAIGYISLVFFFFLISNSVADNNVFYVTLGVTLFNPFMIFIGVISSAFLFKSWEGSAKE